MRDYSRSRIKRVFDIIFGVIGIVISLPIILLAAALIKLDDGGPVMFTQRRIGQHGKTFLIYKLRTMKVRRKPDSALTLKNDPRLTRIGPWLRKFKVDELPQLINVIKGEMSLVGYRPDLPEYIGSLTEELKKILAYKPGITSPASLFFYNESELLSKLPDAEDVYLRSLLPCKACLDMHYLINATLLSDLKIMMATAMSLFGYKFKPDYIGKCLPCKTLPNVGDGS